MNKIKTIFKWFVIAQILPISQIIKHHDYKYDVLIAYLTGFSLNLILLLLIAIIILFQEKAKF